jgi:hypothetical protein
MLGFTILLVKMAQVTGASPTTRFEPRRLSVAAMVCLLLMCVGSYDAIHLHRSVGPLEGAPLTSHHCLLCLAAHFPVTISAGPATPIPHFTCAAPLPPEQLASYESAATLVHYIRPPPQE